MCTEVYRHQHIETGGNLFGLWTTSGSAVIHVVPGPGKNCRRTTTSFHQDIEYMHRVGRFVNDNYMLCHIGEWHSHHSLSLNRPSTGDEQTVRRNFPQGVTKFLVIIANIRNTDTIVLSPYFFTDGGRRYEKAEYVVLDCKGPFSTDDKIVEQIRIGAEGSIGQQNKTTLAEKANNSRDSSRKTRNQQDTGLNYKLDGKTSSTCAQANQSSTPLEPNANSLSQVDAPKPDSTHNQSISNSQADQSPSGSQDIPSGFTLGDSVGPMDTDMTNHITSEDGKDTSSSSENSTSVSHTVTPAEIQGAPDSKYDQSISSFLSDQSSSKFQDISSGSTTGDTEEQMDTDDSDLFLPESDKDTSSSSRRFQVDQDRDKNDDDETPSEREIVLKKVYDELKYWFGTQSESVFDFETSEDCPGAIEISFKHNYRHWLVRFPAEFPTTPAKLFHSTCEASVRYNECSNFDLVKPLKDEVNILLTMKNICGACKICRNFRKESLCQPDFSLRSMDKLADSTHKLVIKLDKIFPDVTKFNVNYPSGTSHAEIRFEHDNKWWIIELPAQYPDVPAKVYSLHYKESSQRNDVMLFEIYTNRPRDLNTSKLIIQAINCRCFCSKCADMQQQY